MGVEYRNIGDKTVGTTGVCGWPGHVLNGPRKKSAERKVLKEDVEPNMQIYDI